MNHKKFCEFLRANGFDFYSGVPCSILDNIIKYLSSCQDFMYVPATREDEAMGIAVGAFMGGKKPIVLMQNSGLGVSVTAITSLVLLYQVPVLLIVSWRGYEGKDAPQHLLMGSCMMDLLKILNIPAIVLSEDSLQKQVVDAIQIMKRRKSPVAVIIKRGLIE